MALSLHPLSNAAPARLAVLLCLGPLAGCSTPPTAPTLQAPQTSQTSRVADPAPLKAFAARGYEAAVHETVVASRHDWPLGPLVQQVQLLRPAQAGAQGLPVVVYLPGLGETAAAGSAWRQAWAMAGYAVLSVQPLPEDAQAFQSDLAREGAFRTLGQQRHAGAAMVRRLQVLLDVLAEARRRGRAGEAAWVGLDWDRLALAGYDLGAHSAMVLAGEQLRGAESLAGLIAGLPLRAVVAFSPYADIAAGGLDTRYSGIHQPVLSITSEADGDPLGVVAGAVQRQAPFEHTAGPGQALLTLQGLAHARLSGSAGVPGVDRLAGGQRGSDAQRNDGGDVEKGTPGEGGSGRGRNGGGQGGQRGQRSQGGGEAMRPGGGRSTGAANAAGDNTVAAATATALRLIAAQDVSTAFLDAHLRDDSLARDWLRDHASAWLGTAGELRQK